MNYRELTRKLRVLGCEFDRQAKGDHEIWIRPTAGARTTIPNWGSTDLRTGAPGAVPRDLGITRIELDHT
ncbi:MAG: type II toxin-antitoxin system HicA family toxin [Dehalococcoidia bacterium]|nr:type II toxin-antitoxin system HicA family toxin [Dehalococcoidia bacterium]